MISAMQVLLESRNMHSKQTNEHPRMLGVGAKRPGVIMEEVIGERSTEEFVQV